MKRLLAAVLSLAAFVSALSTREKIQEIPFNDIGKF